MPVEPHTAEFRVYYEDTDAGGIVYHANHLKFAERGRTDMLRATGWDHQRVLADFSILLVVRRIEVDYRAPAKLDDWLAVTTTVTGFGNASLTMTQIIRRDTTLIAELTVVVVAIGPDGRPCACRRNCAGF